MNKAKALLGLGVACVACCAVPLALPALAAAFAGLGLASVGALLSDRWLEATGAAVVVLAVVVFLRRRRAAESCAVPSGDGRG